MTGIAVSAIGVALWKPKTPIADRSTSAPKTTQDLPTRYFYCIQTRDELPEWDPMNFAEELLFEAEQRTKVYLGVKISLSMEAGKIQAARSIYKRERPNNAHISATLNQMLFTLNTLGKTYPDVLQIVNKISLLRELVDNEAKKRRFLCAANMYPQRFMRACHKARGGINNRAQETLTWTEVSDYFRYDEDDLLF